MTTALYTRILGESKRMVFTYSFLQTTKCASSFGHLILNIFCRCSIVRDDASKVCEFLYHSSGCSSMWILGATYEDLGFGWWSTSVFFFLNQCSQLHVLNCIFSLTYDIRVIQIHPLLFDHRMNIEATWGPKYSFERTRLSASLTRGCMENISH